MTSVRPRHEERGPVVVRILCGVCSKGLGFVRKDPEEVFVLFANEMAFSAGEEYLVGEPPTARRILIADGAPLQWELYCRPCSRKRLVSRENLLAAASRGESEHRQIRMPLT